MEFIYPFFISFMIVFFSELGDKTQLLVLSFSTKVKSFIILFGVAIGSFLSHGTAILFGSTLGNIDSSFFHQILEFITYSSFLLFGIITFLPKKDRTHDKNSNHPLLQKFSSFGLNYVFIIAYSIAIGELGDKTFLASIGLGINYPNFKLFLILGAVLGMIISDSIAIFLGKFLSKKIKPDTMEKVSGLIFLLFGIIGIISFLKIYIM